MAGPTRQVRTIVVRDLDLSCRVGVEAGERSRPQTVRVNLEVLVDASAPVRDDDLGSVVDYSILMDRLRAAAAGPPVRLLESLAERLAAACWFDGRVRRATIRLEKVALYDDAAGVGIAIERHAPRL